jgi:hypothetical protein
MPVLDIPKDKRYPLDAVQCDGCGGNGCHVCEQKGWLPYGHARGRRCELEECPNYIKPGQTAIYCSSKCAQADAD